MITKVNKIKNLGLIFSNYTREAGLVPFKKYNLIYGWNGCGKTSFSRLFGAISGVSMPGLEYEIENESGAKFKENDSFNQSIRVFNQDYIQNNLEILEGRANSISILLGQENKELSKKIEADNLLLNGNPDDVNDIGKIALLSLNSNDYAKKKADKDGKFTDIAKAIGAAIGGNALRDYRRPQAVSDFDKISEKVVLDDKSLLDQLNITKQDLLPALPPLELRDIEFEGESGITIGRAVPMMLDAGKKLMARTVEAEVIGRLAENTDIASWVETGISLHEKHTSLICEYCQQEISSERIRQLAAHFNTADKLLKQGIDVLLVSLRAIYDSIQAVKAPDRSRFYTNLVEQYDQAEADLLAAQSAVLSDISALAEELKKKKENTTVVLELSVAPDIDDFLSKTEVLGDLISKHNVMTEGLEALKATAIEKLKTHFLSGIYDEVQGIGQEILRLEAEAIELEEAIREIRDRIITNMENISSKHKACEEINRKLSTFLNRDELKFVPHTENERDENGQMKEIVTGYDITCSGVPVTHLSEGEKTAIALAYFVVHLADGEFDGANGIVVIDDPVSSLDSNSLFQAFSFIKNAVKDVSQVFILTHNFDFLRLLLNWLHRTSNSQKSYFMIKNQTENGVRVGMLEELDKDLKDHESEYHYLFKILSAFNTANDGSIAMTYPIPNIARKVLDTFLMFRVPNSQDTYHKLESLKRLYDKDKIDAIYKFTNVHSHISGKGFDPSLIPESQKAVAYLLDLIDKTFPEHYKILTEA